MYVCFLAVNEMMDIKFSGRIRITSASVLPLPSLNGCNREGRIRSSAHKPKENRLLASLQLSHILILEWPMGNLN